MTKKRSAQPRTQRKAPLKANEPQRSKRGMIFMLILSHGFLAGIGYTIGYRSGKGKGDVYMPSPSKSPLAGRANRNRRQKPKTPPDPLKKPPARFSIPKHTAFKGPKNAPIVSPQNPLPKT